MSTSDESTFRAAAAAATQDGGARVRYDTHYRYNPQLVAARFVLENGLRVVLMPDTRAPVFAYQTWFRVGSKDEDPARTGLAHLFEHLMFKGTKVHPAGELDREMERRGSQTNAATWVDWTYYTMALASRGDNLRTVVEFESDRMHNLALEEDVFRSELDVVKNERRMTVDDSVTGRIGEALFATAFEKHPYRWPTIGHLSHLETMTLDDAVRFYRTYYAPNNATVVVAGALDAAEALTLLARGYGRILPSTHIPPRPSIVEPRQTAPREVSLSVPSVTAHVFAGYHAPGQDTREHAALEMLHEALATGDNARLYKRLVTDEELATEADAFLTPWADQALYELVVTLRPGASPERVVEVLQEELDAVTQGISDSEWNKAKNGLELSAVDGLAHAEGCAEALGHHESNSGDFSRAFRSMERWRDLAPDELRRVAREVFRADNRTVVVNRP